MNGFFDRQELEIPCPQCKTKFTKRVRELKQPGVKCPKCGVALETSQFKRELHKAERTLKDFQRSLKDIKIDIKL
jgi:transcription initiation factor IIE alpha subunit